jgi:hypothetical protein
VIVDHAFIIYIHSIDNVLITSIKP